MSLDEIRAHCLKKRGKISEEFPFDENVLVFKVFGKIFLLTDITAFPVRINLKCKPALATELRERYDAVRPGYHMNKKHWNTVKLDGSIPRKEILDMIDHSFHQVALTLPRSIRDKALGAASTTKPPKKNRKG